MFALDLHYKHANLIEHKLILTFEDCVDFGELSWTHVELVFIEMNRSINNPIFIQLKYIN